MALRVAIAETKRIRIEPGFLGGGVSYIEAPFGPNVLAISPDEKRLAAGGRDGLVRIFDLSNGSSLLVLNGHRNETLIRSIAYSPDGSRLLTAGGSDGTARLFASDRQLGGPELLPGIERAGFSPQRADGRLFRQRREYPYLESGFPKEALHSPGAA